MKNSLRLSCIFLMFAVPNYSFGQDIVYFCNSFDTITNNIYIESSGIWEIGEPSKSVFDSSYNSTNSIVTDLNLPYPPLDTSVFYTVLKHESGHLPNYLGYYMPVEIEFDHRFITDSITDFGSIELSIDNGITWYDVLTDELNPDDWSDFENYHYFESTGDTIMDSLSVYGSSNGWVHSKFSKDLHVIAGDTLAPDSVIIKFSFISDSIGGNDGWQIDNLCISMDLYNSIDELNSVLLIYPNPNNGTFFLENTSSEKGTLKIFNLLGREVYSLQIGSIRQQIISADLIPGIYIVALRQSARLFKTKITVW